MEQTPNLELPYIMPSQAQKHVTHNEAVRALDALVQLAVLDRNLSTPPAYPAEGSRYAVAAGGSGAWAGKDGKVAAWQDGAWAFLTPRIGWLIWVADELRLLSFDGSVWVDAAVPSVNPAPLVGINATADATNRLSVKSPASLFDHEGGDHRLKINKAAAASTAALLFQSGYSGRAEFGLAGDDDWHVKVSPDGSAWVEALKVDAATGRVRLPAALALSDDNQVVAKRHIRESLAANRTYYVRMDGSDANTGLADTAGGAFLTIQKAIDTAATLDLSVHSVTIQVAGGTYAAALTLKSFVGTGTVTILGDETTPSNVVINSTSANAITAISVQSLWRGKGVKLSTTTTGHGIFAYSSHVQFQNVDFGSLGASAGAMRHIYSQGKAIVEAIGGYAISGNAGIHWDAADHGQIFVAGKSVMLTGAPAFSARFASSSGLGYLAVNGNTFSGSATGTRYAASGASLINTNGGGASYLPGSVAGSVSQGGLYV